MCGKLHTPSPPPRNGVKVLVVKIFWDNTFWQRYPPSFLPILFCQSGDDWGQNSLQMDRSTDGQIDRWILWHYIFISVKFATSQLASLTGPRIIIYINLKCTFLFINESVEQKLYKSILNIHSYFLNMQRNIEVLIMYPKSRIYSRLSRYKQLGG